MKLSRLRRLPPLSSKIIHFTDPQREERRRVEAFVEQVYADSYGRAIVDHYPTLMSIQDDAGSIYAVAGYRRAADGPLFLETYLDQPVETAIGQAEGRAPARASIVEIGNLVSDGRGASAFLFCALAQWLRDEGHSHAVATATAALRGIFAKAGFSTVELAKADPRRAPGQGQSWGTYYQADPLVLAGAVGPACLPLETFAAAERPASPVRSRLHYSDRETES